MKPEAAKDRFVERLGAAGLSLDTLTPAAGVAAMLDFYADERADGCAVARFGDVLLFQWATNDWGWGDGPMFEVSIVRQLKVAGDPEEEPRQLNLRFRYDPAAGEHAGEGASEWCESPDQLAELRRFIAESGAMRAVGQVPPRSLQLWYTRT